MTPRLNITSLALHALQSRNTIEAKRRTDDGMIWPFLRGEMNSPARIRERIAEDAQRLLREGRTCLTTDDFLRLGWRREQLEAHGETALKALNAENDCGNDHLSPEVA